MVAFPCTWHPVCIAFMQNAPMTEHNSTTPDSPAAAEPVQAQPATPDPSLIAQPDFPPIGLDDPEPSNHRPALPALPRTTELRASERWRVEITKAAGPLGAADSAIGAALNAQATMADGLEALEVARQTRDPRKTPAEHLARVRGAFENLLKEAARKRDAALVALSDRERALAQEVEARTSLTPSPDAVEIRQTLQRLDAKKRGELIDAAMKSGDKAVLGAIFSGREMTTGVSDVLRDSLRRRYEEQMMPGLHSLRAGIKQARALVDKSFDDLSDLDDHVLGSSQAIDEFHRQTQAADDAWFALSRYTGV